MARKWTLAAAFALVLLLSGSALAAYNPNGEALPPGATGQAVYQLTEDTETWVRVGSDAGGLLAQSWNSGPALGYCNRAYWDITFTSHASVAQWIDWTLATTRKDWRVRKPGTYASDSIDFTIASNNEVWVSFDGFDDLQYLNPDAPEDTTNYIETYYGVGSSIEDVDEWVWAGDLNEMVIKFPNSDDLHHGLQYKIWQAIVVVPSNSSSEYENVGTIRIAATNLKFWIDGQTGGWAPNQFAPAPTEPYTPATI